MRLFHFQDGEVRRGPGATIVDLDAVVMFRENPIPELPAEEMRNGGYTGRRIRIPAHSEWSVHLSSGEQLQVTKAAFDRILAACGAEPAKNSN